MQISAEWVSAVIAALVAGGGLGQYFERKRSAARHAEPILRDEWTGGTGGFCCSVEIVNRLDEDLYIQSVDAKSLIMARHMIDDGQGGGVAQFTEVGKSAPLGLTIPPMGTGKTMVFVSGLNAPRWLRLTISSSANSLRNKRLVIQENKAR